MPHGITVKLFCRVELQVPGPCPRPSPPRSPKCLTPVPSHAPRPAHPTVAQPARPGDVAIASASEPLQGVVVFLDVRCVDTHTHTHSMPPVPRPETGRGCVYLMWQLINCADWLWVVSLSLPPGSWSRHNGDIGHGTNGRGPAEDTHTPRKQNAGKTL